MLVSFSSSSISLAFHSLGLDRQSAGCWDPFKYSILYRNIDSIAAHRCNLASLCFAFFRAHNA